MGDQRSSSKQPAAEPVKRGSGIVAATEAVPFADALAEVRRRMGSSATGPATDEERAAITTMMAERGFSYAPPPIDFGDRARELDMSEDELREMIKRPVKP